MTGQPDPLAPVRAALLDRARAQAGALLDEADAEAARLVGTARREAAAAVDAARAQGEADAEQVLVGRRARAGAQVRALQLAARREAYDRLRAAVRAEAAQLAAARPGLAARLADEGRRRVGGEAALRPGPEGAVVADLDGTRWSWSPADLADDVVRELGEQVEQLWAP